jgi:hypothetical protein
VASLGDIINVNPTSYEEDAKKKEWKDAMVEEYQSIVKNDVWDVVPRPNDKTVVSSKGFTRRSIQWMEVSISTRKYLWHVVSPERRNRL